MQIRAINARQASSNSTYSRMIDIHVVQQVVHQLKHEVFCYIVFEKIERPSYKSIQIPVTNNKTEVVVWLLNIE